MKHHQNNIINAMNLCLNNDLCDSNCKYCCYQKSSGNCMMNMMKDAIDLIEKKDEALRKAEKVEHYADKVIEQQKAELERLKEHCSKCDEKTTKVIVSLQGELKRAKVEVMNELAEKLFELFPGDKMFTTISKFTVRNIFLKMEGDSDGCKKM